MRIAAAIGALFLLTVSGCAQTVDRDSATRENASGSAEENGTRQQSGDLAPEPPAEEGAPIESSTDTSVPADPGGSKQPFVGQAKSSIPVISILSSGRLEIVDGCLTVALDQGRRAVAILPVGAKLERSGGELTAVSIGGRRIPLNQDEAIPGGGSEVSPEQLVEPIPASCPKTPFVLGG